MVRSGRDFPVDTIGHILPTVAALSTSNLFVVSGAGFAIPIIPAMETIIRLGISGYDEIGSYPARLAPRTELRDRLLPNRTLFDGRLELWKAYLLAGIYDEAIAAFFQRNIYRRIQRIAPANYRIFDFVPPPAVIFDFNTDDLLAEYCAPPHIVLNPHGAIERRIIEHPEFEQFLRAAAEFAIALPNKRIWLPGPEPKTITRRPEYNLAIERMRTGGKYFLLIGYSFGRQRDGRIDDAESFEFLGELLKRYRRQIIIVDPTPEHVAGLFENRLRQRIYACKLYWNHLAEAACLATAEIGRAPNLVCLASRIARLYEERTR